MPGGFVGKGELQPPDRPMPESLNHDLKSLRIDRSKKSATNRRRRWIPIGVSAVVVLAAAGGLVFRQPPSPLLDLLIKARDVEVASAVRNTPPKDGVALTAGGYVDLNLNPDVDYPAARALGE